MKNIALAVVLLLTAAATLSGQHREGDFNLNLGIGLFPTFGSGNAVLPPVGASGEYGINDDLSVGGYLAISTYKENFSGGTFRYSYILVGPRASYHLGNLLGTPRAFDPYAGVFLGYRIGSTQWDGPGIIPTSSSVSGTGWSLHLGTRYQLNERLRLFGELGYGVSILQAGISWNL
jgi:hypothetical protein